MNSEPLISIIMACFNCEPYIKESIDSVLNQTYRNWELVIVDDASTDGSVEVIKSFDDTRIKIICLEKNTGPQHARNVAISSLNERTEFVAVLDSDDISFPERLSKQVNYLLENEDISIVGSNFVGFENDLNEVLFTTHEKQKEGYAAANIPFCSPLAHSTCMFRWNEFKHWTIYDESFPSSQDYDFLVRVVLDGKKIICLEEILVGYRVRQNSISHKSKKADPNTIRIQMNVAKAFGVSNIEEYIKLINFSTPGENHGIVNYIKAIRYYLCLLKVNKKKKILVQRALRYQIARQIYGNTRYMMHSRVNGHI